MEVKKVYATKDGKLRTVKRAGSFHWGYAAYDNGKRIRGSESRDRKVPKRIVESRRKND